MEVKKGKNRGMGMKAQMFSLTALIFVLLMVVTLLVFVIMSIGYDNLSESSILSTSSTNYGRLLTKSADSFAYASGTSALSTLFRYEFNSSFRQTNFISNLSYYMRSLMSNAVMPNVPLGTQNANTIYQWMGNATFASYNSEVSAVTGISSRQVIINQTTPQIFQINPYSINIKYTENVQMNTSSGQYSFAIPVNVSIPLNNTPDLFYAQQGIYRPINFANIQGSVKNIGDVYAVSGNTVGFVYGSLYFINPTTTCATLGTSNNPPSPLNAPPYSTQVILVDPNAQPLTLGGCAALNNYGGLITSAISTPPAIPYLVFPSGSNVIPLLQTNQQVLLYGPGMSVLNISNLISEASSQSYFVSPFATSYMDRVVGDFQQQSPSGMFTLFPYSREAGVFNAVSGSYIETSSAGLATSRSKLTVGAWVYPTANGGNRGIIGQADTGSNNNWNLKIMGTSYDFVVYGSIDNTFGAVNLNTWQYLTAVYNSGTVNLYLNGQPAGSYRDPGSPSLNTGLPLFMGDVPGDAAPTNFNGLMSNFQVYNSVLSSSQINYLYQEGVEGIPVSNAALVGWWPLNGNSNDYSGNPYAGTTADSLNYSLLPDYTRDSAFVQSLPTNTYPIPGLMACNSRPQCYAPGNPAIYLGDAPLTLGNSGISVGYFNGQSSTVTVGSTVPISNVISVSAWINLHSDSDTAQTVAASANFILSVNSLGNMEGDYWINLNNVYTQVSTGYPLKTDQWYLLSGTFKNNALSIYVNGQLANTIVTLTGPPIPLPTQPTTIGYWDFIPTYFNGTISNVQIYNSTLTAAQEEQLYLNGISGAPVDSAHIVGWWPLNGNTNDYTGYSNNGNPNNVAYLPVALNYSQFAAYNSIGLTSPWGTSDEWQSFGFPGHS